MKPNSANKSSGGSPTPLLRKWQKNKIFEAIQAVGFDPREFDLDESDTEVRIKHKWSASYFVVRGGPGHYVEHSVVGDPPAFSYDAYSWPALMSRVSRWLEDVDRDLATPDLWAERQREVKLLGPGSDSVTENTPFTPDEQKEIAERLQELAEHARHAYSLSRAQSRVLDAKLDYLISAAGRLGRIDWRNTFAGAILGFILTAALPPEFARDILLTPLRAIGHLYSELSSG